MFKYISALIVLLLCFGGGSASAQSNTSMIAECDKIIERISGSERGKERIVELYKCIQLLAEQSAATTDSLTSQAQTVQAPRLRFIRPESYGPGWSSYPGDANFTYQNFSYAKTQDGFIHLSGLMSGCESQSIPIFTLPDGYRPTNTQILSNYSSGAYMGLVLIQPDGRVFFWQSDRQRAGLEDCSSLPIGSRWLSLAGLSFHISN